MAKSEQIENETIDLIMQNRELTRQRFKLGELAPKHLKTIERIYLQQSDFDLNGKATHQLVEELKRSREEALYTQN